MISGSAPIKPIFQSTPPVKAATPFGEGGILVSRISIHAAREGGDAGLFAVFRAPMGFQSTPPVKAATLHLAFLIRNGGISIHAAREGGDAYR